VAPQKAVQRIAADGTMSMYSESGLKTRSLLMSMVFVFHVMTVREGFALARVAEYPHLLAVEIGPEAVLQSKPPLKDFRQLMRRLRATGEKVRRAGKVEQPFFSVKGQIITVGGEEVQVFEYATTKAAEREAKSVSDTGSSVRSSLPRWIAPPHFYKSGRLIVLYVGESSSVIKALGNALGPQFAGQIRRK
jgi:hypothetical protein